MVQPERKHLLYSVILFILFLYTDGKEIRLKGGDSDGEGYLEIKINSQWLSICAGNRGLVQAACRWDGYATGKEIKSKSSVNNRRSWSFNATCPSGARDFSTCKLGKCVGNRRLYLKCSGYPHCRMEDGTLIPGNSSLFVGNNKVCRCNKNNVVECDCRNIAMKCKDGTRAKVDNQCRPTCSVDKTCTDRQVSSLCSYYKKRGQCGNKTVQNICRNTCEVCDSAPTPTLTSECVDQYDSRICESWRGLGGCARENVREVCEKTCGSCSGEEEQNEIGRGKEEESTERAVTENRPAEKGEDEDEEGKTEPCKDEYDLTSCKIWKDSGYCSGNESVRRRCKETCGVCRDECRDTLGKATCEAAKRYGSCSRNMKLLTGCAETCGLCQPITDANCVDLYRTNTCKVWSKTGRCDSDSTVPKICAESCGACTPSLPSTPESTEKAAGSCKDNSNKSLCSYYKSAGYCTKRQYVTAMRTQCRKTCDLCAGECKDREEEKNCRFWKQGGHCKTNSNLRERICPLTCGTC